MRTHKTLTTAIFAYGAAALVAMAAVAHAEAPGVASVGRSPVTAEAPAASAPACRAPAEFARFVHPLAHTSRRLASDAPLVIVAIGSSSTAGAGASSPAASYPNRLAAELKLRFPTSTITVINRGINGEETDQMLARFDTDVLSAHPDLVVWQVGTNSVMRDHSLERHAQLLHEGIGRLKQNGADVVLMDMQYAPKVLGKAETPGMEDQLALTAKQTNIDLFERFAIMRDWHEVQHIAFETFGAPDGLHMNDWGYGCLAKTLADAIAEAATRPVASAHSRH
jgi:acyl-CoA thioesterase I